MILEPTHVGSFFARSETFIVADPCNSNLTKEEEATLHQSVISRIKDCRPGKWEVFLSIVENIFEYKGNKRIEEHCWALSALHEEVSDQISWTLEAEVIADSGQIGIFDEAFFGNDDAVIDSPKALQDSFYGACVYLTYDETKKEKRFGGCLDSGAIALSGYGDGLYPINVGREGQWGVGFNIPFIIPE